MKKAFFHGLEFDVFDSVYEPAEDSFLLAEQLLKEDLKGKQVLDLGCGIGIQGIIAAMNGARVIALDENNEAIKNTIHNAQKLGQKLFVFKSNLFSFLESLPMQEKVFDLIVFNAPYLPSDEIKDKAIDALKDGCYFINCFLENLSLFLKPKGKALIVVSSLNKPSKVFLNARKLGFAVKVRATKKFFFEKLFVLELIKKKQTIKL